MQNFRRMAVLLGMATALAGCSTFVKLTPAGENVAVLQATDVANCQHTGTTTVSVVNKVVVNRSPQKVATELRNLARNRAADRGDTIVPSSDIRNGEQSFNIYRCRA